MKQQILRRPVVGRRRLCNICCEGDLWANLQIRPLFSEVRAGGTKVFPLFAFFAEDYHHVSPTWRDRNLAASVFNLRGALRTDNELVKRTRASIRG